MSDRHAIPKPDSVSPDDWDAMLDELERRQAARQLQALSAEVERLKPEAAEREKLEARIASLEAELALWKPMTPEEAEAAYDAAESDPLSDEEIAAIMAKVMDPTFRPTEPQHVLLVAKIRQLEAENARLREVLGRSAPYVASYIKDGTDHITDSGEFLDPDEDEEDVQARRETIDDINEAIELSSEIGEALKNFGAR